MPTTTIIGPDGEPIKVGHPEGASKRDIGLAAKAIYDKRQSALGERSRNIDALRYSDPSEYDPNSDAFKAKYGAASGGFLENLAAGAGKAFVDIGRGTKQLGLEAANFIPGVNLDDDITQLRQKQTESRALDKDLMSSGGGLTGNIGANIGLALLPGGLASGAGRGAAALRGFSMPASLGAAAGSGAVQGALQPVAEDESRLFNAGAGAAFGAIGNKLVRPFAPNANAASVGAANRLTRSGVPLDVAQRTQSGAAKKLASMLDDSMLSAGARQDFKTTQLRAFTRAALETIGEQADEATPQVMNGARTRIGSVFNNVARKANGIRADATLYGDVAAIYRNAQSGLLDDEFRLFERNFRNIMGGIDNGRINATRFNSAMTDLGGISSRQNIGTHARALEDALLNALGRTSPRDVARLDIAKAQWRNLRALQGAVDKGASGLISPMRLSATLGNKSNQNLSVFGLGRAGNRDLAELAQAGRELLKEAPNSGTPARLQLPTAGVVGAAYAAGGPLGGLAAAGGIRGAAGAMNSQGAIGNYLSNGLPIGLGGPLTQLLIQQGLRQQEGLLQE